MRRIIAIIICLLVVLGTVACAADKKEQPEKDPEEEADSSDIGQEPQDPFDPLAACFVQAMFEPDLALLLETIHPDALSYMTHDVGLTEEELQNSVEHANATISEAWDSLDGSASYEDLTYVYAPFDPNEEELAKLHEAYDRMSLAVEDVQLLDITVSFEEASVGSFTMGLVLIDGTWWTDPILTTT